MAPRQLVRLKESRKSDTFNDQKTPSEILQAESVSTNHEEIFDYVISQLRQILGTNNWFDAVPTSLSDLVDYKNTFPANCLATDSIGDAVYSTANDIDGIYQVTKCDPANKLKMPCIGVIKSKSDDTNCRIQYNGLLAGIYGELTINKLLFVGLDGGLTHEPPSPLGHDYVLLQPIGTAITEDVILIQPSFTLLENR